MAIQKICCFSNETEVNRVSYTCGGYHCACSAHIRQTSHSMLLVLLNVQEDADTLWLHCYHCLLTIQEGPCCFGDETGTWVRYTCGHSHDACSAHIRQTSHSMLLVLLNVQEDADTLWLHCYHCLLTIQEGPCYFGDETGTWVRYTCGHYHYACSAHIRDTSCAQCRGSSHERDSKHTDKYAVSEIHWYTTAQTEAQVAIPTSNTHTVVYYYTGNLLLLLKHRLQGIRVHLWWTHTQGVPNSQEEELCWLWGQWSWQGWRPHWELPHEGIPVVDTLQAPQSGVAYVG